MDLLWLIILGLIGIASVGVPIAVVVFLLRDRSGDRLTLCGQCGYPKQGSAAEQCPECGWAWNDPELQRKTTGRDAKVVALVIILPTLVLIKLLLLALLAA